MPDHRAQAELEVATAAARAAGALLLDYFALGVTPDWKGIGDPVTVADRAAEQVIRAHLAEAFPGDMVVGEEGEDVAEAVVHGRRRWYVDPLDGTINFMRRRNRWGTSIAFCDVDDTFAAAVVFDPVHQELTAAARGHPTTRNGRPVQVSQVDRLADVLVCVGPHVERLVAGDRGSEVVWAPVLSGRVTGSTVLDLADVASGRADAYLAGEQGRWDLAAGTLLIHQAGGHVTDEFGTPVAGPADRIVAAAPRVHAQLLEALSQR